MTLSADTEAPEALAPLPALIGDVGGTNARFAVVGRGGAISPTQTVGTADFATMDDAVAAVLDAYAGERPVSAVLAIAGVIQGEEIPLTNCAWVCTPGRMVAELGFHDVILLNDFEALSLSLPGLADEEIDVIGPDRRVATGPRLVLGPGTGLGAGALLHAGGRWVPVPGEGGHLDIGPRTPREEEIWHHIERIGGRVSGEQILSGEGMVRLYRAVVAADGETPRWTRPSEITAAAGPAGDPAAVDTLDLFATYLGRHAGNLALVFMPTGGVYLGGGITGRIAPFLKRGGFREGFVDKAPHRAVMEGFTTAIITHPYPALAGIAAFVRDPRHFAVALEGKRWHAG
jgi:glucokinase